MTPADLRLAAEALVQRTAVARGLPRLVTDATVLARAAGLFWDGAKPTAKKQRPASANSTAETGHVGETPHAPPTG